jgi:serine protease Do
MLGKYKSTIIALIVGALVGTFFMLLVLGYVHIGRPGPIKGSTRSSDDDSRGSYTSAYTENDKNFALDDIETSRHNAIVRAAEKIGPAVVSLSVIQVVQTQNSSPFGSDFWDFFNSPPPARERQVLSLGSGVIINPKGYVLTNYHVVTGAKEIRVTLENGAEYPGRLIGTDPITDLAVVKILTDTTKFTNAVLGNSDDLIIGEWAIAVGNPFGYLLDDPHPTVTVGVISATNRDIKPEQGQKAVYRKMIQTDAAINPGNSGGPLVNALGEVIGINTFIFSSSRGSEGIGFAVPINRAKVVIDDILKYGGVVKAWVGLNAQNITPEMAHGLSLKTNKGIIISSVIPDSPASRAGLKTGDILLSVGKLPMENVDDWEEVVNYSRAGRALPVQLQRGDRQLSIVVVPDEVPTHIIPKKTDQFGIEVADITPAVASYMNISDRNGVIVRGVQDGSRASDWGLQEDDIIRQIGNYQVNDVNGYLKLTSQIGSGYKVVMMVERLKQLFYLQIIT